MFIFTQVVNLVSSLAPLAFLFLRAILSIMFIDSGRRHLLHPVKRAESLGLPVWFTFLLGLVEVLGGIAILLGVFTQMAAILLAGVMLGALYFKVFVWKTGIYGKNGGGWYYDALLLAGVGILATLGAGEFSLTTLF